jgi:hypothetical protein
LIAGSGRLGVHHKNCCLALRPSGYDGLICGSSRKMSFVYFTAG